MPTAYKTKSGSWQCQVFSHFEYVDGKKKKIRRCFTVKDPSPRGKRECEQLAAAFAAEKDRISYNNLKFSEAVERYIASRSAICSPATIRSYERVRKNAFNEINDISILKLTTEDVQRWENEYSKTHSAKTCKNAYSLISGTMKMFQPQVRLLVTHPAPDVRNQYTPNDKEVQELLKLTEGTELHKAIILAAFGSLRRCEICALTDADINGNTITVNKDVVMNKDNEAVLKMKPKNSSSVRTVSMPANVMKPFRKIRGPLVDLNPQQISNQFRRLIIVNKMNHIRFHDLRHYTASIMHAKGIPDVYIMQRGGWSSDVTLKKIYRNSITTEEKKFNDKINKHFDDLFLKRKKVE